MNYLAIMQGFNSGLIVALILIVLFTISTWAIKTFILKHLNFIDIASSLVLLIISFFANNLPFAIVLFIASCLVLLYSLYDLVSYLYKMQQISEKTNEYIKNNEYDFFIQMDDKEHITDCSTSILKLTKLSKKEVLSFEGWKFIFDSFDVKTINKEEFTLSYVTTFLSEFKECNSRHRLYKFSMEATINNDLGEEEVIKYDGIIQPVFCQKKLVARNIFFYQDRGIVVERLKNIVRNACTDLEDAYLQLDVMMSMSEGIVMYYDFQNKVYVATDCMCEYTKTHKKEYTFEELFSHIHPDDIESYIEQAQTVGSLSVTKIKYRLSIGGIYYQVEEDSIYLRKEYGLVSIIRIAERSVSQSVPQNAKIQKDLDVLNDLASRHIISTLDKTTDILSNVLGDKENED